MEKKREEGIMERWHKTPHANSMWAITVWHHIL